MCCQTFGTHSFWSCLLYWQNQEPIQSIPFIRYNLKRKNYCFTCWTLVFLLHLSDGFNLSSIFNVFSFSQRFTQGPPEGSFLAPLLFLFYINNLAFSLNDDAVIVLFANDVSILTTARQEEHTEAAFQSLVNSVLEPGMEIKFERTQNWGTTFLHLIQR